MHHDAKGKETVLKTLGGLAVYVPNEKRSFDIVMDIPKGLELAGGTLKVLYVEKEKEGGKLIAQSSMTP